MFCWSDTCFLLENRVRCLFSSTREPVCVCRSSENRKRTKCQMYIFNMVVLSVNLTSERDFWLPQKNISGGRLSKELTIRYYYNNNIVEGSTVWVDPNRSNSLWTSENTSHHSFKSRVLHALEVSTLGEGGIFETGALPLLTNIKYRSVLKPKYLSGFKYITTYENKWHYTPRKYGLLYEYFNVWCWLLMGSRNLKPKSLTLCYSVLHQEKFKSVTITHKYAKALR